MWLRVFGACVCELLDLTGMCAFFDSNLVWRNIVMAATRCALLSTGFGLDTGGVGVVGVGFIFGVAGR